MNNNGEVESQGKWGKPKKEPPATDTLATRHFVARWRHFVLFMNPGQTVGQSPASWSPYDPKAVKIFPIFRPLRQLVLFAQLIWSTCRCWPTWKNLT